MNGYGFVRKTFRFLMTRVLFPTEVVGNAAELPEGPLVLASNHLSAVDVILLIGCTERQISFMAKKELFSIPLLGSFLRAMGAFPVDRGSADVSAVRTALRKLDGGALLGIFPQGTRCPGRDPSTTKDKLRGGVVMTALHSKAPILPVGIYAKGYRIRLFGRNTLAYGKPILYEEYAPFVQGKNYLPATEKVFDTICGLTDLAREHAQKK